MNKETVLVVDDKENIREVIKAYLENEGFRVITCGDGERAVGFFRENMPDIVLTDFKLPGIDGIELIRRIHAYDKDVPVIVFTAYGSISSAVEAIKAGGYDYLTKPLDYDLLKILLGRALEQRKIKMENKFLKEELNEQYSLDNIVGSSDKMQKLFSLIKTVAASESTILIEGEYGTGKELVAKAIHRLSRRSNNPLVIVDCSALPEQLLESELFGYEKGAFTGAANRKKGRIEIADGGTLFLDEIGEMGLQLQAKLLRVIQEKQFIRLGGLTPIKVDFRLIAATNRKLREEVDKGSFRADLFYRLNVIKVNVPPLRERREDIPLLVKHFIDKVAKRERMPIKKISPSLIDKLLSYDWPGNVRELENCVERMMIVCDSDTLTEDFLPHEIREVVGDGASGKANLAKDMFQDNKGDIQLDLHEIEKDTVIRALKIARGNKSLAAKILNIDRKALYNRIKKYNLY